MGIWPSLAQRVREPELMDERGLDAGRHVQALVGLARINRVSNSAGILWPELAKLTPPARVLDIACGGGDVTLALARRASRAGLPITIDGCDLSATAVALAASKALGLPVRFFALDVLTGPLPAGYDAVVCSLFLHHLSDADAVCLLARMAAAAEKLVLVNDLARGRTGLLLAQMACHLLTRSRIVHTDGPISVRAAFTPGEALELARRAGLDGVRVERRWPCRYLVMWRRDAGAAA